MTSSDVDTTNCFHQAACLHLAYRTPHSLAFLQAPWMMFRLPHLWAYGSVLHPSTLLSDFIWTQDSRYQYVITPKCIIHSGLLPHLDVWKAIQTNQMPSWTPELLPKTWFSWVLFLSLTGNFSFIVLKAPNLWIILHFFLSQFVSNPISCTFKISLWPCVITTCFCPRLDYQLPPRFQLCPPTALPHRIT